jgi:hypothetical protein
MAWSTKGIGGPPLVVLWVLYKQRVLITLQITHATSILKCFIVVSEGFSRLTTLSIFPFLSFFDMLFVTDGALKHNLFFWPLASHFGFAFLVQSCVLSLCISFPPLLGVLFNGSCQSFIIKFLHHVHNCFNKVAQLHS